MKMTKEELKNKINGLEIDDDTKIGLLEDVEDSMDVSVEGESVDKATYDTLKSDYDALKQKYKERFLSKEETKDDKEDKKDDEEVKENEVIDVKEI